MASESVSTRANSAAPDTALRFGRDWIRWSPISKRALIGSAIAGYSEIAATIQNEAFLALRAQLRCAGAPYALARFVKPLEDACVGSPGGIADAARPASTHH